MIRDVADFRRTGVAGRRIAELSMPVEVWRAAMCQIARRDGARIRTFVVPASVAGQKDPHVGGMVFAVRVDPPPDRCADGGGHVRWWHVDELGMPFSRWRAALHRTARRVDARVHTFLVPAHPTDPDTSDQMVYLVWADAEPPPLPALESPPPSARAPRPVTDLLRYAAARHPSAGSRCEGTEH